MNIFKSKLFNLAAVSASFTFGILNIYAQTLPDPNEPPTRFQIQGWSFNDTNWLSNFGYAPVASANLVDACYGNNGWALLVDSAEPAFVQYNVFEADGTTNLTVDSGSIMFWMSPDWSGTNNGGTGPGQLGRLIEVGAFDSNGSNGWWSLYLDSEGANIYFSAQAGDGSKVDYLSAPIAWNSNEWHHVALTYSATNSALYLDGALAATGEGVSCWPTTEVLRNGFFIGADATGILQARAMFDDLSTWNYPVDSSTIFSDYALYSIFYPGAAYAHSLLQSAPLSPPSLPTLDAITGAGFLQLAGSMTSGCVSDSNVWITNLVATSMPGTNLATFTFGLSGGYEGVPYDVFATAALTGSNGADASWAWMGQGYPCNIYSISNLPAGSAFLVLGTMQDSDKDGLTDAFERLVNKSDSTKSDTTGDGLSDYYKWLHGLSLTNLQSVPTLSGVSFSTCPVQ